MKTIEEMAMQRAWCEYRGVEYVEGFVNLLPSDNFEKGYMLGRRDALASQWRRVEDETPEESEYVIINGPNGIEAAVWNDHFQVWDDAEGDDFMYKKDAVKMWMSIPQPPVYARTPKDESE